MTTGTEGLLGELHRAPNDGGLHGSLLTGLIRQAYAPGIAPCLGATESAEGAV
ncbi:hypothetical protein OHA71_33320 [Streptomyces sp. NBC_00444]|uniref:hypothetical protein n=1 Tax=Streptomyces sp. NBC_00444 TaxID=2975744 RepID=UPI002E1C1EF4